MRDRRTILLFSLAFLGIAFVATPARALVLAPNDSNKPAVAASSNPLTGTTIVANTGVQNFNVTSIDNSSSIIGTGQAWVVSGWTGNQYGLNDLTFVYQVSLTGGIGSPDIGSISVSNFASWNTDAFYFNVPTSGQLSPDLFGRASTGAVVTFNYNSVLLPGKTSALLIIATNALSFKSGAFNVQDGVTANLMAFSPTPEPGAMALALIALPLLGFYGLRRRSRS